eukprot:CAMPEP_0183314766 /NCGR_PEP_ID=MMETSP0160_2-20130417/49523_1 /TAXON_ID=2839 ORGANISM="Odontella Sinensis, Strain Grunow 1884" /NCGR_SAMPLE_ID=MMETSP0160_2 /ASSEMBLY_ACC=CAM_ASM_000250 /LENGTH=42 /DNA_ID= /DNA_START= /DNA_END= /DNA_ORIENTATION=
MNGYKPVALSGIHKAGGYASTKNETGLCLLSDSIVSPPLIAM